MQWPNNNRITKAKVSPEVNQNDMLVSLQKKKKKKNAFIYRLKILHDELNTTGWGFTGAMAPTGMNTLLLLLFKTAHGKSPIELTW